MTLAIAVAAGVLLTELLMSPPGAELRELAAYFAIAGASTMLLGWLGVRIAERSVALTLRTKAFLAAITGSAMALINVLLIAQLMFVSTAHDLKLLVAVIGFSGVVTVSFTMWMASAASRRIGVVADGIRALAADDYVGRVNVDGGDEVSRLADDVNMLAGRLHEAERSRESLDRERRDLTAAISHDLRTPLASMRAMVEALDDAVVDDPAEVARYHQALRREIERLSRMVDDLFELSRIDSGMMRLELQALPLQEIAAEIVHAMSAQARRAGISLTLYVDGDPLPVRVDGNHIERAISNLVRNALEHTPSGGEVSVHVAAHEPYVEVSVADTGKGLASDDLPRIWNRFARGDKSRNRDNNPDGGGLGLAIVRAIVEAHGGLVRAESRPEQGSVFAMLIPDRPSG